MKPREEQFSSLWEKILLSDAYFLVHQEMEEEMKAYGVPDAIIRPTLTSLDDSLYIGLEQICNDSLTEDNRHILSWVLSRYIDKLHTAAYLEDAAINNYRSMDSTDMPDIIETQMAAAHRYRCTAATAEEMLNALT